MNEVKASKESLLKSVCLYREAGLFCVKIINKKQSRDSQDFAKVYKFTDLNGAREFYDKQ